MKRILVLLLAAMMISPVLAEEPVCWVVPHDCLTEFLIAWAQNDQQAVLDLCAPSWKEQQTSPETQLFILQRNCTPLAWNVTELVQQEDNVRSYDVQLLLDKNDGGEPAWYAMTLQVVQVDDKWYVEPSGLAERTLTEAPEHTVTPATSAPASGYGDWWHEAGAWNHAGVPEIWAEHQARFTGFMEAWMNRDMEGALSCLPSGWEPDVENPRWELERRFYIYVPQSYTIQSVMVGEDTRRVTYAIQLIDEAPMYRLQVIECSIELYWDSGVWYVDPATLPQVTAE